MTREVSYLIFVQFTAAHKSSLIIMHKNCLPSHPHPIGQIQMPYLHISYPRVPRHRRHPDMDTGHSLHMSCFPSYQGNTCNHLYLYGQVVCKRRSFLISFHSISNISMVYCEIFHRVGGDIKIHQRRLLKKIRMVGDVTHHCQPSATQL